MSLCSDSVKKVSMTTSGSSVGRRVILKIAKLVIAGIRLKIEGVAHCYYFFFSGECYRNFANEAF